MAQIKPLSDVQPLVPGTYIMPQPPEFEALHDDPRLEGLPDRNAPGTKKNTIRRHLAPQEPPKNLESRFVILRHYDGSAFYRDDPIASLSWLNKPPMKRGPREYWGGGLDLAHSMINRYGAGNFTRMRLLPKS